MSDIEVMMKSPDSRTALHSSALRPRPLERPTTRHVGSNPGALLYENRSSTPAVWLNLHKVLVNEETKVFFFFLNTKQKEKEMDSG